MGRTLAIIGICFVGEALSINGQAQSAQWCAYFTGGPTNCGFATFEQCLQTIKGKTALCNENSQNEQNQPSPPHRPAPAHRREHRLHQAHRR